MPAPEKTIKTLETEQAKAVELASKALSAIDTVTALSSYTLTVLSIIIALVSLVGLIAVFVGSKRAAQRVADAKIKEYIEGEAGKAALREAIKEEVKAQLELKAFVVVQPSPSAPQESSFPPPPQRTGGSR
ncbi:hypothetical protein [Methylorubrum suomiense]|uniref:hypothetical protein n=1 Tax=Methylorubrum suomiense TaxID=144191 RepID=UPI001EE305B2|nr:hypothetical protein [Methylorubrum suomiense]